ncbi:MAG: hypothetical protein IJJ28_02030 [Lentisphaeria bacterium]|nr:hypothetical protein [Lentisphaeria bacterium]
MSETKYTISGREIYSAKGKLVATLDDDGNPVMAPGMAGPHKRALEEFLGGTDTNGHEPTRTDTPPPMPPLAEESDSVTKPEAPEREAEAAEYAVSTIPDDRLPPFSKALGVNTPGFAEFVDNNHLSAAQVAALVKRLERR